MTRQRWTKKAIELLKDNHALCNATETAFRINVKLGTNFTAQAIQDKADALGIKANEYKGLMTLKRAAAWAGVDPSTLRDFIDKNDLTLVGTGRCRFLTPNTWEAVQKNYPPLPEECIDPGEAAKRLHYTRAHLVRMVRTGRAFGYRRGDRLWIPVREVERLECM